MEDKSSEKSQLRSRTSQGMLERVFKLESRAVVVYSFNSSTWEEEAIKSL